MAGVQLLRKGNPYAPTISFHFSS